MAHLIGAFGREGFTSIDIYSAPIVAPSNRLARGDALSSPQNPTDAARSDGFGKLNRLQHPCRRPPSAASGGLRWQRRA
ncbi:hypothetical protein CKO51_15440 [Rhodopirellula sp. SM50]|nr:hypothetical protein CKO51_15440 [Rhodopirellula sp. SM50]